MSFLIFFSYLTLAVWVYLVFFHGRKFLSKETFFWSNKIIFERQYFESNYSTQLKKICVIIPARNEEKTICRTLNSVREQNIKNLEIIVVNDNSTDKTAYNVKKLKTKIKNLYLLNGKKLPNGWAGKTWALKQGVDLANKKKFDYYNFIDSDIVLSKNILKKVVNFVESKNFIMLSLMAKLNCESLWEKILIPPFIFFFQKLYPFNLTIKKNSDVSAAAGGFIFCKASVFREENLYVKIKNKIIDDCNIAKIVKAKGLIWIGLTNRVYSNRKYKKLSEIWKMVSRSAFEQLQNSIFYLVFSIFGLAITYLFPLILFLFNVVPMNSSELQYHILLPNLISFMMMLIIYLPTCKFYKITGFFSITLPISAILFSLMTLNSALNHIFFHGNIWKGRKY